MHQCNNDEHGDDVDYFDGNDLAVLINNDESENNDDNDITGNVA